MVSLGEYFNGVQIVYIVDDLEPSDEIFPFWKHENNSYDIFAKIYFEQYWKFKVQQGLNSSMPNFVSTRADFWISSKKW
jgi:hypothetical protein